MAEGTIKRITDKGFGFIRGERGADIFFHMSSVE
jgi:cold shock protein